MGNNNREFIKLLEKKYIAITGHKSPRFKTAEEYLQVICEYYENIIAILPNNVYWRDKNCILRGCNNNVAKLCNLPRGKCIGLDYEQTRNLSGLTGEQISSFKRDDIEVMSTGKPKFNVEEPPLLDKEGKPINCYISSRVPILDKTGSVVGVVGISIDIIDSKEKERLQLENELQKAKIEEHEKFAKIAHQVSHDMRSSLISLETMVTTCADELPESIRVSIRDATIGIGDIAHNLLCQYSETDKEEYDKKEARQPVLLSLTLLQSLTEKRYQYKSLPVKFDHDFGKNNNFVFIKTEPTAFKRMISNLVNNAVDAFEGKPGEVNLKMVAGNAQVKIIIQDNGKGIPKKVLDKIRSNTIVSSDKKGGHGLGLGQVRETLQRNGGEIAIESTVGKGTKITLTFQIVASPEWIADEICVRHGDMVVILDDDPSVHNTWEMRFKNYMDAVTLKHFTFGEEAISYLNAADKDKLILLTDFELLKQEVNGLQVIERTQVPRSILVTSHFNKQEVRDSINKLNIKILPKQLAPEVPIKVVGQVVAGDANLKKVDVVIVEDSKMLADGLAKVLEINGKTVDVYYSGSKFLENFAQYHKDVKFCLDYSLGRVTGLEIAKKINEAGYNKLYLCTGWDHSVFEKEKIPDCVVMLTKGELDKITKALME